MKSPYFPGKAAWSRLAADSHSTSSRLIVSSASRLSAPFRINSRRPSRQASSLRAWLSFSRRLARSTCSGSGPVSYTHLASILCSYFLSKLERRELNNILFVATGALMSPTSSQQGESIPGIAHLIHLTST